ncbi:MAG: nucleoside monophosphate kinase [Candidatus Cloacimonadaceae bacterium]
MKCYAFLGIQGSGKGTQAEKLSNELDYQHINIGDLFRYHIKAQTAIGIQVKDIIHRGELVSDELVFDLIKESISPQAQGIIFDGFPRTIAQAQHLLKYFQLIRVFYLDLPEEIAIERISARRICRDCQQNYNLNMQRPKVEGICDQCGGKLMIRQDDSPEAIHKRFLEFYEQTSPLREFFEQSNLLSVIKAKHSIEDIFAQIMAEVRSEQ